MKRELVYVRSPQLTYAKDTALPASSSMLEGVQMRSCQFRVSTMGSFPKDKAHNSGMSSSGKVPRIASARLASSSATVFTPITTEETALKDKQKRNAASARPPTSLPSTLRA